MTNSIEKWIREHFDRQSRSMTGSCETITYVRKHANIPACPGSKPRTWNRIKKIGVVFISLLIALAWTFIFAPEH